MIKTIFWDFDGVILDSMKIKGDGFTELFHSHNSKDIQKLEKFHYANGGVSRFDKIKYFYRKILNQKISDDEVLKLAKPFYVAKQKLDNVWRVKEKIFKKWRKKDGSKQGD